MITLYRQENSREADAVQERLEDLVLAHRVVKAEEGRAKEIGVLQSDGPRPAEMNLPADVPLPAIIDGHEVYTGGAITSLLDELESDVTFSRQVSADACYVDPDNPNRCI